MRLWPNLLSISAMQVLLVEDDEGVASALAELLGQAGGAVRAPLLELTGDEKATTRAAFEACGLKIRESAKERTAA